MENSRGADISRTVTAPHIAELDGIRGIAILLVMIGHGWPRFSLLAVLGVGLFFVLSGFLITGILLRSVGKQHYFQNFYIRRALRIWPLYYLILAVAYLTPLFPFSHTEVPAYRFLLYIQNFWPLHAPPILGTTWSLAIEEQFYMVWPLVVLFGRTPRRVGLIAAILILITPGIRTAYHLHGIDPYALTLGRVDGLAMGAAFAALTMFWTGNPKARSKLIVICLAISISLLPLLHFTLLRKAFKDTSVNFAFVGLLAFAVYWRGSEASGVLRSGVLRFFGKISYCAYLVHVALIYKFVSIPVAARLAIAVTIATASWYFVESPILGLKDSLTRTDAVKKKVTAGYLVTQ